MGPVGIRLFSSATTVRFRWYSPETAASQSMCTPEACIQQRKRSQTLIEHAVELEIILATAVGVVICYCHVT